jgi:uncharacterized repeat protein (TIGR01451 family)
MKHFALRIAIAATITMSPAMAHAASGQVSLHSDVKLEKTVTDASGSHMVLVDPKTVLPGERLLFTTNYVNTAATPVRNFVVTNPLPSAVRLAADKPDFDVSVDGGHSWGKLAAMSMADGKGGHRPAGTGDVTHVRWTIALIAPGASGHVDYEGLVR